MRRNGERIFDVRQFGAKGVGGGNDGPAIQSAIDGQGQCFERKAEVDKEF